MPFILVPFFILAAVWVLCGLLHGAAEGSSRKNNPRGGMWLAMFTGPFLLLFIDRVADKRTLCPYCRAAIEPRATICPWCDAWLTDRPRVVEVGEEERGRVVEGKIVERGDE